MAARLDILFFLRRNRQLEPRHIADTEQSHRMISLALAGAWASGFALLYQATGFALENFSPKLWMKLFIVGTLTLNALAIAHFILPKLRDNIGRCVLEIPLRDKLTMAACATTSAMCWLTALALGASSFLKTQSREFLTTMVGLEVLIGFVVAAILVFALKAKPRHVQKPKDHIVFVRHN